MVECRSGSYMRQEFSINPAILVKYSVKLRGVTEDVTCGGGAHDKNLAIFSDSIISMSRSNLPTEHAKSLFPHYFDMNTMYEIFYPLSLAI